MSDTIVKIFLSLLSLGAAVWTYTRWRKKKNLWLMLALVTLVLAAAAFWLGLVNGAFMAVVALALLFLGLWTRRGAA
jgi:endonuclease/exonuclease/phosphatase (EEP) superfamily protein YafD